MNHHPMPLNRWLPLSMVVLVLALYSYPAMRTTMHTGSRALPPISAPDLSLYLNLSSLRTTSAGQVVDPYYGITVPAARMGYLKFRLAFHFFAALNKILHGDLWWTLLLWNLFWWGLLCVLAWRFFEEFLPHHSPGVIVAGLGFLMLFNFGVLETQLAAWLHLLSLRGFPNVAFPYIRPFFPQVPVALLLLYLLVQIKVLQKRSRWLWAALVLIQFLAFAIFPYATVMMAGITAVAIFGNLLSKQTPVDWLTVGIYAVACAVCDLLFFLHGNEVARAGAPGQYSLIHLQLSVLSQRIGGMWLVLVALTIGVCVLRDLSPEIKWPVAGLGFSTLFLLIGDVFFSETALQVSHHAGYVVQLAAAVLLMFLLSTALQYLAKRTSTVPIVLGALIVSLLINGTLLAHATYKGSLAANEELADLARVLQSDPPQASDLVIARSLVVDDDCAWVPLVSGSHVLFCRSAQVLLSPEQNQHIQRFRQALYLYFTNRDSEWVKHVLVDPNALAELLRLTFLGQVTTNTAEKAEAVEAVRTELLPELAKAENHDPQVQAFLSGYRRVLVVDNLANPYFSGARLSSYLKIERQWTFGKLLILDCVAPEH